MEPIKVFFCVPTDREIRSLRRFVTGSKCTGPDGYHHAKVPIGDGPVRDNMDLPVGIVRTDERWPAQCSCGYAFKADDDWQVFGETIMRRIDTGEEFSCRAMPPGAVWNEEHLNRYPHKCGPDGRSLYVMLPDKRTWFIDGRARNCTLPDDKVHRCWVRHGRPEDGTLHVDKNGVTCDAGAGSIDTGTFHGFLHNGFITDC